ncbi:hypothetical protein A3193_01470 [Candidatus Thiodiazotropha endoloripes]|uniref:hypothetical protein n=1 Tax=Candidatus Thiodiazotropha endoloripes TaxID=1818881 RepID=UPI00083D48FB|nr:hypothetical protein [Candidatus Thiodiazotropha endoloripes]ODB87610.1 hypothetical protein A3193_01470 [Candidatus Thiodiazotropha endoloripes]
MKKLEVLSKSVLLSIFILTSLAVSAAPVEYVGQGEVVGFDGEKRCIRVSMHVEDRMVESIGVPPDYATWFDAVGYFPIYTYLVEVEGLGVYAGANGRLNIWLNQTPGDRQFYTEELEILEDHGLMQFNDGTGGDYDWASWLDTVPSYEIAPELVIRRLNITPGYGFDLGNDIHLFPMPKKCYCKKARGSKYDNIRNKSGKRRCGCNSARLEYSGSGHRL